MAISGPVGTSIIGIIAAIASSPAIVASVSIVASPAIVGIPWIIVASVSVAHVRVIASIIRIPEGESKSPAGITPTHAQTPVKRSAGIEAGIVGIKIVPPVIII
jgi:hypothetical protein